MKKHFLNNTLMQGLSLGLLFPFASVVAYAQHYNYENIPNDPVQTRIHTPKNGLKVYLSINKEKPYVQTYIAMRTSSRNDPKETTGLVHYLEHLMFKGATYFGSSSVEAGYPYLDPIEARFGQYRHVTDPTAHKQQYRQIDSISQLVARCSIPNGYGRMIVAIGSKGTNAYTPSGVTCYVENIPSNGVDTWVRIQSDRFRNMVIRGFHTGLEAVYEGYNIGLSSDRCKVYTALLAKLFPTHPYGTQTTTGLGEHLKSSSVTNIGNYFNKYYVPGNIAICLSSDLDLDKTVALIEKYFGDWKPNAYIDIPQFPTQPALTAPVDMTVVGKETPMLFMGQHADTSKSLQLDTLEVIVQLLPNGRAGPFDSDSSQKLKVQKVSTNIVGMDEYSVFYVYGQLKNGQTLQEVRNLALSEVKKLKKSSFSDGLLPSIVNNCKRYCYMQLNNNQFHAKQYVDAFINHRDWKQGVGRLNRISKLIKTKIVKSANQFSHNDFACAYKKQGNDTTIKKVGKPTITPIPTNNGKQNGFLEGIVNTETAPIQPQFIDYKRDLTKTTIQKGLPVLYKQDKTNDLFTLCLIVPRGNEHNPVLSYATGYLGYLDTNKLSNEQIRQQFYKLACDYGSSERNKVSYITLSGLNSDLPRTFTLLSNLLNNAKVGKEVYDLYIEQILKSRSDSGTNRSANFTALRGYATYEEYNPTRSISSEQVLELMDPRELFNLLKNLKSYKLTVFYYGPLNLEEVNQPVSETIQVPKKLVTVPTTKRYTGQTTPRGGILIAPYDIKDIYMVQFHSQNQKWSTGRVPIIALFDEYFGGGMNAIVFQELHEARGLAYSVSAIYASPYRLGGNENLCTHIITWNDKVIDCVAEFNEPPNNVPIRQSDSDLIKQSLAKNSVSVRTTKYSILTSYPVAQHLGLDTPLSKKIYNAPPSLQLQDVINPEKGHIANKTFKYIILDNGKELDIRALEKIAPIERVTTREIFGY